MGFFFSEAQYVTGDDRRPKENFKSEISDFKARPLVRFQISNLKSQSQDPIEISNLRFQILLCSVPI